MHHNIARVTSTSWLRVDRVGDFVIDIESAHRTIAAEKPSLVFLTTPNNPTGTITAINDIRSLGRICAEVNALLVVDEAYQEFSQELIAITLIDELPNIIVCRTMSKAFAFAGARVGYLVANPAVIEAMLLVSRGSPKPEPDKASRNPGSVNAT